MNTRPAKSLGFSLIEMMVAIVIVALLIALGIPSYKVWIHNTQIRTAAESIQNGMQKARAEAVARNTNVTFALAGLDSSWVVSAINPASVIESRGGGEGSKNVTLTVLPLGATTITFSNLGMVVANADASATLTQIGVDSPLLDPADSRDLRVTVATGGNVKMCDPNLATGSSPLAC